MPSVQILSSATVMGGLGKKSVRKLGLAYSLLLPVLLLHAAVDLMLDLEPRQKNGAK